MESFKKIILLSFDKQNKWFLNKLFTLRKCKKKQKIYFRFSLSNSSKIKMFLN